MERKSAGITEQKDKNSKIADTPEKIPGKREIAVRNDP